MLVNGYTLQSWGWRPGPEFGAALARAHALELLGKGIDEIQAILATERPRPQTRLQLRSEPAPLTEAIRAETTVESTNLQAVRRFMHELLRVPIIHRGTIMPDACPAGSAPATITVGGAIAVDNAIIPSAHSADICCSMFATVFTLPKPTKPAALLDQLQETTRFGAGGRGRSDWVQHDVLNEPVWTNPFLCGLEEYAAKHLADQGDGNHFAYLGTLAVTQTLLDGFALSLPRQAKALRNLEGQTVHVLVTHHGSRGLGAQLYKRGTKVAEKMTEARAEGIPAAAYWIPYDTQEGRDYWAALQYVARWTKANHELIHAAFVEKAKLQPICSFGNEHNFVWARGAVDRPTFYHGKGATPAWKNADGQPLVGLIPLNMAEPILIVAGGDNDKYLSFAPHGAGRNLSRTAMLRAYEDASGKLDATKVDKALADSTKTVDVRWYYGKADLSESPLAYKSAQQVTAQIEEFGLATLLGRILPLGCIMAGDGGPAPWLRRKLELSPKEIRQITHRSERRKVHAALSTDLDTASDAWDKTKAKTFTRCKTKVNRGRLHQTLRPTTPI